MTVLEKARLFCPDSNELDFQFMFNPDKVQFKEAVKVGESESARTKSGRPKVSFEYPKARTLRLKKVMFDTYESGEDIMAVYIDLLRKSVQFQGFSTSDTFLPRPPIYKFIWGSKNYITCFIEKLDYKLTMFLANGTPVRAEVNLSLKEVDDSFLSAKARTYNKELFGDRDIRKQPPEPISVAQANQYYLNDLKDKCENGKNKAKEKRRQAKRRFNPDAKVVLYEQSDRSGKDEKFGKGDFKEAGMKGMADNTEAIEVPAGYIVEAFYGDGWNTLLGVYREGFHDLVDTDSEAEDNFESMKIKVDRRAKQEYEDLMAEANALEKGSEGACKEYEERKEWC